MIRLLIKTVLLDAVPPDVVVLPAGECEKWAPAAVKKYLYFCFAVANLMPDFCGR